MAYVTNSTLNLFLSQKEMFREVDTDRVLKEFCEFKNSLSEKDLKYLAGIDDFFEEEVKQYNQSKPKLHNYNEHYDRKMVFHLNDTCELLYKDYYNFELSYTFLRQLGVDNKTIYEVRNIVEKKIKQHYPFIDDLKKDKEKGSKTYREFIKDVRDSIEFYLDIDLSKRSDEELFLEIFHKNTGEVKTITTYKDVLKALKKWERILEILVENSHRENITQIYNARWLTDNELKYAFENADDSIKYIVSEMVKAKRNLIKTCIGYFQTKWDFDEYTLTESRLLEYGFTPCNRCIKRR